MAKKKGGKKKGGKGGGKGGKKGGDSGNEMTLKEAIIAFQIQIKQKAAEDLEFEIRGLREKNSRFTERNARLKDEQLIHIKTLLRQAKEQENELEQHEIFNSEHVEEALKEKWEAARLEEKDLDELRKKIKETEIEYDSTHADVEYWTLYKNVGSVDHKTQIQLLNNELDDMQQNFDDMCAHLKRQLDAAKGEVKSHMDKCMAEQKHLASEKAMEKLDPASVQEVLENDWLKNEAAAHRVEVHNLQLSLEELERENLERISQLLDCHEDDLKISRNFMHQYDDDEEERFVPDQLDMNAMSIYQDSYASPSETPTTPSRVERPKSAKLRAVEDKVFSIKLDDVAEEEDDDDDGTDEKIYEEELIAHQDESINVYEDKEFLHLGPLEIKLLCVVGEQKPIYELDDTQEIVDGTKPDITVTRPRWPIETPMLRAAVESVQPPVLTTTNAD